MAQGLTWTCDQSSVSHAVLRMNAKAFWRERVKAAIGADPACPRRVVSCFGTIDPVLCLKTSAGLDSDFSTAGVSYEGGLRKAAADYCQAALRVRYMDGSKTRFQSFCSKVPKPFILIGAVEHVKKLERLKEAMPSSMPDVIVLDISFQSGKDEERVADAFTSAFPSFQVAFLRTYSFDAFGLPCSGQRMLLAAAAAACSKVEGMNEFWASSLDAWSKLPDFGVSIEKCLFSSEDPQRLYEQKQSREVTLKRRGPGGSDPGGKRAKHGTESVSETQPAPGASGHPKDERAELFTGAVLHKLLPEGATTSPIKDTALHEVHGAILAHRYQHSQHASRSFLLADSGSKKWKGHQVVEGKLPDVKPSSDVLCFNGDACRPLCLSEVLRCKGYSGLSLNLLSPAAAKSAVAEVTPSPVVILMLLMAINMASRTPKA